MLLPCGTFTFFCIFSIRSFFEQRYSPHSRRKYEIGENVAKVFPEKSEVKFVGRNMYRLKKACILPKRKGIVILHNYQSDVESVAGCNGLFYQNEYGIRKVNIVWFKSSEVSDIKWLSRPAHIILPSSIVSFWHFLQSLIPAYEFVVKNAIGLRQPIFYFLENRFQADSKSCDGEKLFSDSSLTPLQVSGFQHNYSTEGIYDMFTSPFEDNVNVDELESLRCHEDVIIGSPLMLHHSAQEWQKILQKKKNKLGQRTLKYIRKDFFSIPVENGYQKEYVNALKKELDITECTCSNRKKPLLLLIKRKFNRRLVNEEEIEHIANDNFETTSVFLENLLFIDQLKLFSCASVAVGAAGTGMTWIIFMREGASVILFQNHGKTQSELMEKGIRVGRGGIFAPTFGTYTNFAHRSKLHIQVWQPQSVVKGEWKNSHIFIDTSDFLIMLNNSFHHVEGQQFSAQCMAKSNNQIHGKEEYIKLVE